MTLEEFHDITKLRIPTPEEFLAFTVAMKWHIAIKADGSAALCGVSKSDLVAVNLARMLGREPYRSNVLALLLPAAPGPDKPAKEVPGGLSDPVEEKVVEQPPEEKVEYCPKCKRPSDRGRCWRCHWRGCSACGRDTTSAFIELCLACDTAAMAAGEKDVVSAHP